MWAEVLPTWLLGRIKSGPFEKTVSVRGSRVELVGLRAWWLGFRRWLQVLGFGIFIARGREKKVKLD